MVGGCAVGGTGVTGMGGGVEGSGRARGTGRSAFRIETRKCGILSRVSRIRLGRCEASLYVLAVVFFWSKP
jgi:hypothetical protein